MVYPNNNTHKKKLKYSNYHVRRPLKKGKMAVSKGRPYAARGICALAITTRANRLKWLMGNFRKTVKVILASPRLDGTTTMHYVCSELLIWWSTLVDWNPRRRLILNQRSWNGHRNKNLLRQAWKQWSIFFPLKLPRLLLCKKEDEEQYGKASRQKIWNDIVLEMEIIFGAEKRVWGSNTIKSEASK